MKIAQRAAVVVAGLAMTVCVSAQQAPPWVRPSGCPDLTVKSAVVQDCPSHNCPALNVTVVSGPGASCQAKIHYGLLRLTGGTTGGSGRVVHWNLDPGTCGHSHRCQFDTSSGITVLSDSSAEVPSGGVNCNTNNCQLNHNKSVSKSIVAYEPHVSLQTPQGWIACCPVDPKIVNDD